MKAKLRRAAALALALLALAPGAALAQPVPLGETPKPPAPAGPTEDARMLFNVGAQAYQKGDFAAAVAAFEQAYRLAPRPGILFSLGQAHRKHYYTAGRRPEHLRAAIASYREYLAKVEQGGRRSDAAEALVELEALASKLDMTAMAAVAPVPTVQQATRLMVTSQTSEATISLDGGKPREAPLVADVTPGKHNVRFSAPGFFDEARDVEVAAGSTIPLDVPMREKPARVDIQVADGAQISIDGRFAAAAPLTQPLDVAPGHHLVTVTRNGFRAHAEEIDVGRDEARALSVRLESTTQRSVAYGVLGVGVAGVVAGAALAAVAVYRLQQAESFVQQQGTGTLACATPAACQTLFAGYQSNSQARDDFRLAAGVALGAGVAVGAVGLMLFAFDQPTLGTAARSDDRAKPAAPPPRERPMEMAAAPLIGPGLYGVAVGGRF
jgi:hypothetical protein